MVNRMTAVAAIAVAAIVCPVLIINAGTDGNGDGCVDLQDFAILQNQFTGPTCTPTVMAAASYFAEGTDIVVVEQVPGPTGFVLTDVIVSGGIGSSVAITLLQEVNQQSETKARFTMSDVLRSYHLQSGVPFAAGTSLVMQASSGAIKVTLTGYVH